MKIMFLGDSLTEGIPGVSFFKLLEGSLSQHKLINRGKGGDTVKSLNRRAKKLLYASDLGIIFLWVGTNDIFVKVAKLFPIVKTVANQPWAKDISEFEYYYNDTLEFLSAKAWKIVVIPPVFIGEDINNTWNRELAGLDIVIRNISSSYENVKYLDIRSRFFDYLRDKPVSDYVPYSAAEIISDAVLLKTRDEVDDKSSKRGLYLTLDGVHFNSTGAGIVSDSIRDYLALIDF